jgi:hypothetical protein
MAWAPAGMVGGSTSWIIVSADFQESDRRPVGTVLVSLSGIFSSFAVRE